MGATNNQAYHIIGMSPGNSYFKDEEIHYLLKTIVEKFGRVAVLVADVPAISTYIALGYSENRARRDKAIPKGNALKNRVIKIMSSLGYSNEMVKIFDWKNEVENNKDYKQKYQAVAKLYKNNKEFRESANRTTRQVLEGSNKNIKNIEEATNIAVHYLLSEISFLEFAPIYLNVKKVVYTYHKNWRVYEDYISGRFDGVPKHHLDFLLIENPYETYNPIWGLEEGEEEVNYIDTLDRIEKTKTLRVGFSSYPPAFIYKNNQDIFSGIFHDIMVEIAQKHRWQICWTEEVGYGVIIEGLNKKRFDIFGSTIWPTPERKLGADFSESIYLSPTFIWVRPDYQKNFNEIKNNINTRVSVKENDISESIAKTDFPNQRLIRVPQLSDAFEVLGFVAKNRADLTFAESYLVEQFNKTSAVKLVKASEKPIRVYENTIMFRQNESRLKNLLNKELSLLKKSGLIAELIEKYTGSKKTFLIN